MVWELIWRIAVPDMPDCMVVLVRCFGGVDDGVGLRQQDARTDALDAPGLRYEFEVAIRGGPSL